MFNRLIKLWNNYGFEILVGLSIIIILILALFRIGKKGTWSKHNIVIESHKKKKGPPKDSKGETECRRVLQEIFNMPFPKARPDILNNPVTGGNHNLELDCYNSRLKLAVEYNGRQHYEYTPFFHRNKEHFMNQKYRDELKRRMCRDNGITLIEVPYTVKNENISNYLVQKIKELGFFKK